MTITRPAAALAVALSIAACGAQSEEPQEPPYPTAVDCPTTCQETPA